MAAGPRWGLVVLGVVLLVSSAGLIGYTWFAQWQHAAHVESLAPPTEALPARLAIPTRSSP
jgi:cytochrome c-type biogenesis protein CcmH/NrfG